MARPDIKRVADLKGKKIGITRIGSSTHTAVLHVVNKAGLGPNDYALLQLGEVPNILTTLLAGQIDAGALSPPTNSRAKKAGLHELVNLGVDGPEYPSTVMASTRAYVKANPDNSRRMVRALGEGLAYFQEPIVSWVSERFRSMRVCRMPIFSTIPTISFATPSMRFRT